MAMKCVGVATIHVRIVKYGFISVDLGCKLIAGYLKFVGIDSARKMFDELYIRDVMFWNSMIAAYSSHGRYLDALALYRKMILERVPPDEYTFPSALKSCGYLGYLREGRLIHAQSVILGFEVSNSFVGSALVAMYSKLGALHDSHVVFNRALVKDVVLFTALIAGCTQNGQEIKAFEVFDRMIRDGILPNSYTLSSILVSCGNLEVPGQGKFIHGIIIKAGFESSIALQTSLLTMYSKCNLIYDSLRLFNRLDSPNCITWTSLISGLVQNRREEVVLIAFRLMLQNSVYPNSLTLSSILTACSILAQFDVGKQVHACGIKLGLEGNFYLRTSLINMYGKCGSVEMAKLVFYRTVEFDIVLVDSMINCYAQNGYGHEAVSLFSELESRGIEPSDITFLNALSACCSSGLLDEGRRIFKLLKYHHDINPAKEHYTCMADMLARAGKIKEAEDLLQGVKDADMILWRTLFNACKIHGEVEVAERIKRKLLHLAPKDGMTHVMLSNFYSSKGNWNEAMMMKRVMNDLGLEKNPAMSWVISNG